MLFLLQSSDQQQKQGIIMKKLLLLSLLSVGSLWLSTDSQCKAQLTAFDPKSMQYNFKQSNQNPSNASSTISTDSTQKKFALEASSLSKGQIATAISGTVVAALFIIVLLDVIITRCSRHVPDNAPVATPHAAPAMVELAEIVIDNMRRAATVAAVEATANLGAAPAA
jgi:hypothetical protein